MDWCCYIVSVTWRLSNKLQRTRIFLSYHESPSSPFFESFVNERVVIICKSPIKSSVSFFNMLFEIDYLVFYHSKMIHYRQKFCRPKALPVDLPEVIVKFEIFLVCLQKCHQAPQWVHKTEPHRRATFFFYLLAYRRTMLLYVRFLKKYQSYLWFLCFP